MQRQADWEEHTMRHKELQFFSILQNQKQWRCAELLYTLSAQQAKHHWKSQLWVHIWQMFGFGSDEFLFYSAICGKHYIGNSSDLVLHQTKLRQCGLLMGYDSRLSFLHAFKIGSNVQVWSCTCLTLIQPARLSILQASNSQQALHKQARPFMLQVIQSAAPMRKHTLREFSTACSFSLLAIPALITVCAFFSACFLFSSACIIIWIAASLSASIDFRWSSRSCLRNCSPWSRTAGCEVSGRCLLKFSEVFIVSVCSKISSAATLAELACPMMTFIDSWASNACCLLSPIAVNWRLIVFNASSGSACLKNPKESIPLRCWLLMTDREFGCLFWSFCGFVSRICA